MKETFVKKYWEEEDILFFLHFKGNSAIRQVEVRHNEKIFLSLDEPVKKDSMLYDQNLDDLELTEKDYITKQEFETIWAEQKND